MAMPRDFDKYVRAKRNLETVFPDLIAEDGTLAKTYEEKANTFNAFFGIVFIYSRNAIFNAKHLTDLEDRGGVKVMESFECNKIEMKSEYASQICTSGII